jgi:hypothetical protein
MPSPQRFALQSVRQAAFGLLLLLPPLSQTSDPAMTPSPQDVEQELGFPVHVYPDSCAHEEEHPSPEVVPPSSQVSLLETTLSPQAKDHRWLLPLSVQFVAHARTVPPEAL